MVSQFKDMEVEVKDWNFSVEKLTKNITLKLTLSGEYGQKGLENFWHTEFNPSCLNQQQFFLILNF